MHMTKLGRPSEKERQAILKDHTEGMSFKKLIEKYQRSYDCIHKIIVKHTKSQEKIAKNGKSFSWGATIFFWAAILFMIGMNVMLWVGYAYGK